MFETIPTTTSASCAGDDGRDSPFRLLRTVITLFNRIICTMFATIIVAPIIKIKATIEIKINIKKKRTDGPNHQKPSPASALWILFAQCVLLLPISPVEAQLGVGGLQRGDANRDHMRIAGWWGGPVRDVAVEGDVAVCAIGTRVVVLDVSDKNNPQRTDEIDLEYVVRDVELRDGYAYVVTRLTVIDGNTHQFTIIDVRDTGSAKIVFEYSNPPVQGGGDYRYVQFYGPYALVLDNGKYVDVFNVAVPGVAFFVKQCTWPEFFSIRDFVIDGSHLFLLDESDDTVKIYDLSIDVFQPPLIVSLPIDGDVATLAVEGDYLAVLERATHSVLVFDISDPANPIHTGTATGFTLSLSDVVIADGYLCVADSAIVGWTGGEPWWNLTEGLSIYDIWSDPGVPELVSTFKTHGATRGVYVAGTTAFTFDDGEGLVLVDLENPTDPQRLGTYYSPSTLRQMTKVGDKLYVTDEWNGFTILDVADAAHPTVTGVYQSPEWGYADHFGIAVRDNWAIFAAGYGGIHVVDVADPANPTLASQYEVGTERRTGGVEIDGDLVRIGWGSGNLTNLNFENPPNLTFVRNVNIGFDPAMTIVTTDQGITHLANGTHTVVDNTDPANPQVLITDLAVRSIDLVVAGDYIYTTDRRSASGGGGFYVRDISGDPANPTTIWHFPLDGGQAAARHGSKVFFTARGGSGSMFPESALCQFDVSNSESPVLVNYLQVPGAENFNELGFGREGSLDLFADPRVVYATTREGLAVIKVGGTRQPNSMSVRGQ